MQSLDIERNGDEDLDLLTQFVERLFVLLLSRCRCPPSASLPL